MALYRDSFQRGPEIYLEGEKVCKVRYWVEHNICFLRSSQMHLENALNHFLEQKYTDIATGSKVFVLFV